MLITNIKKTALFRAGQFFCMSAENGLVARRQQEKED
jgi:hypothetical protein